jgi:hypothetical protein
MSPWCSMTRRQVFASFAAAVTTISLDTVGPVRHASAAGEASSSVILGKATLVSHRCAHNNYILPVADITFTGPCGPGGNEPPEIAITTSARAHARLDQAAKICGQPDHRTSNGPVNVKLVHTVERQMTHLGQPAPECGAL